MKKKRLIILLSILAAALAIGCFAYMYFTAEAAREMSYLDIIGDKDEEYLYLLPEHIELGSGTGPGYTARFQDCSLTISGYADADINKEFYNDFNIMYHVGSDKSVYSRPMVISENYYNGSEFSSRIKKAAGKEVNNEYDLWEATFYCTPDDFALLDASKNKGVSVLLERKYILMYDACYQFDNGVIKGFINVITPDEAIVAFSNCKVPDSYYQLFFTGFPMEEVKEMLGTIKFDGSNTEQ